ncbi:MAG: hemerythrin domain-containing protein [Nitrospiraceae bacterium]|nr:hemerythrin domain-containing protein [Nitrospiraceae bacterium]
MQLTEDLAVSITFIDEKIEDIIMRTDNLRQAVKWRLCRYAIENMLSFLEEYTGSHLQKEESHMRIYDYPQYFFHKEKHEQFAARMLALKEEWLKIRTSGSKGSYELSVRTVQTVIDWLNDHVMQDDIKLADFLRKKRPSAG